jgi:hypothetical protein
VLPNGCALNRRRGQNITPIESIHVNNSRTITFVLSPPWSASVTSKPISGRLTLMGSSFYVPGCKLRIYTQQLETGMPFYGRRATLAAARRSRGRVISGAVEGSIRGSHIRSRELISTKLRHLMVISPTQERAAHLLLITVDNYGAGLGVSAGVHCSPEFRNDETLFTAGVAGHFLLRAVSVQHRADSVTSRHGRAPRSVRRGLMLTTLHKLSDRKSNLWKWE